MGTRVLFQTHYFCNSVLKIFNDMKNIISELTILIIPVTAKDYGLNTNLIPRSPKDNCISNKVYRKRFGTCSCDGHCSWDICRTLSLPSDCLLGTDSTWKLDTVKNAWVGQPLKGDKSRRTI